MNRRACGEPRRLSNPVVWLVVFALLSLTACRTAEVDVERRATATTAGVTRTTAPETATSTWPSATDTPTPVPAVPPTPSPTPVLPPEEVTLQVVGQIGGQSLAVAVAGSTAYLGVGPRLLTLDVSAADTPQLLGQSDVLPGVVQDIAVVEGVAYVAAEDAGLRVLDVSDPAHPREMGSAPVAAEAQAIVVQDRIAYLGESACQGGACAGGLRAIDVSARDAPQAMGFLEMPDAVNDVVMVGAYAYVAHRQGLTVVDVSDPEHLLEIDTFPLRGSAEDIAVADGYVTIVAGPYVLVMDTSSAAAPREVGSSSVIFSPNAVAAAGDRVYVTDGFCEFGQCGSHLRALDVSNLAEPRETGSLGLADFAADVVVEGRFAYVVTWESGLNVVDLADPANPRAVGTFTTSGTIQNVTVREEYAYVTGGGENGLLIMDVTDPAAPRAAGALPMLFAGAVALADGTAYVPVWVEGLRVLDVRDPTNPVEIGSVDSTVLGGTAHRVALGDGSPAGPGQAYVYLTLQEGGLIALDVADPVHPRPVGTYTPPAGAMYAVSITDGTAYATGTYTEGDQRRGILYLIDVAHAERPDLVASVDLPDHTSSNVTRVGDYAYVTLADCEYFTCSGSLQVVDVSDPSRPQLATSRDVPGGAFGLTVTDDGEAGRHGYLAAGEAGVWVVDVSQPGQPGLVWLADTPGRARGIAVRDDLIYVGDDQAGLLILQEVGDR